MRLYRIDHVRQAVQRDPQLGRQLAENRRRIHAQAQDRARHQTMTDRQLLDLAASMPASVVNMPSTQPSVLIDLALSHRDTYINDAYNINHHHRLCPNSPEAAEQAVHMIRHNYTNYDQLLIEMPQVGRPHIDDQIYQAIRTKILSAIAQAVPGLYDACNRLARADNPLPRPTNEPSAAHPSRPGYIAFDLETVKPFPTGESWTLHRPLGIACAVTATHDDLRTWHSSEPDDSPADRMTPERAAQLVDFLQERSREGHTIVTWNGTGFDWQILAEESGRLQDCRELALNHIDMMYHLFSIKGFPLSLSAAAEGMAVGEKAGGISGYDAPGLWARGERQMVIEYCQQDARLTLSLAVACQNQRRLEWIARSGRPNELQLPQGWFPVHAASQLPLPDTDWMRDPMSRRDFDAWLFKP